MIVTPGNNVSPALPGARTLALSGNLSYIDGGPGGTFLLQAASGVINSNYFGNGNLGAVTISGSASATSSGSTGVVVSNYASLTLAASSNFTLSTQAQAWLIYVQGNLVINAGAQLTMTARGASAAASAAININRIVAADTTYFSSESNQSGVGIQYTSALIGGAGGVSTTSTAAPGSTATNGTGGGGAGGNFADTFASTGAAGTAFSGGSGAGGESYNGSTPLPGGAGGANGGAGGSGQVGSGSFIRSAGGGAGNPGGAAGNYGNALATAGSNGTGGTIIVICGGTISGTGTISSNGSNGGSANDSSQANSTAAGGGASGGGRIIIFSAGTNTFNSTGTIQANGGTGGVASGVNTSNGGNGGAGAVTTALVAGGTVNPNLSAVSSGAFFINSATQTSYSMDGTLQFGTINTTTAAVTITTPSSPLLYVGRIYTVRIVAGTNNVVLTAPSGFTINGAATATFNTGDVQFSLDSFGNAWSI